MDINTTLKQTSITINKGCTVIESTGMYITSKGDVDFKWGKVFNIRTRKDMFSYISTLECFDAVISVNTKLIIKKIESLGFEVSIDDSFGFDYETKIFATL